MNKVFRVWFTKKKGKRKRGNVLFPIEIREKRLVVDSSGPKRRRRRRRRKKKKKKRIRVDDDDDDDDAKKENRREKKKKASQEEGEVPDWKKVLTRFFPSEGRRETTEAL